MRMKSSLMLFLFFTMMGFAQTVPPTNLKASLVGPTTISIPGVYLSWEYGLSSEIVSFNIYKKIGVLTDTTHFMKIAETFHKYFIDPAQPGNTYSYYVIAVINQVESEPSDTVEIAVIPPIIDFGKISGNLYDDFTKAPIAMGNISFIPADITLSPIAHYGLIAMTDSLGNFSAKLRAGDYFILSSAHGYFNEFFDNVRTIQNATKVTLKVNDSLFFSIGLSKIIPPVTYTVSGWVKDGTGNPQKAMLTAFITNKQHNPSCWDMIYSARTDSIGNYQIKGIRPGDTIVVFAEPFNRDFLPQYYDGKTTYLTADRIGVTGNVTDIDFTLAGKPVYNNGISGTVLDSAGIAPVIGRVFLFENNKGKFIFKGKTKTDTLTGGYSFVNIEPGQYILLGEGRGYVPSFFKYDGSTTLNWRNADSVAVTETSLVTGINFNLKVHTMHIGGGFVFGTVRGSDGSTLPGTLNYIVDANGGFVDYCVTDLDGSYMIGNVDAGSYTMVSSLVSYQNAQNNLSIDYTTNSTLNVDISLLPTSTTGVTNNPKITGYELKQNYPNPFNPSTTISYQIPQNSLVTLKVYNILGNEVATLVNEQQTAGVHSYNFKANNLASGIYFYKLQAGNFTSVRKLTLLK